MKSALKSGCLLLLLLLRIQGWAADSPWQRVVVIGASASSGFVLSEPFGGTNTDKCRLSHYLDAAIAAPHEPLKNYATAALFLSPAGIASQEVAAATNSHPTLLVAVDFLFWFCYGQAEDDAERARRFEYGLNLLDRFHCPVIVGDIPDASHATNSGIISAAQVPSENARLAANQRVRAWAKTRPDVTVVPLAEIMKSAVANQAIKGRRFALPAGKATGLIQPDRLHPTPRGAALLALKILDEFTQRHPQPLAGDVTWDFDKVFREGIAGAALPTKKPGTTPAE